MNPSLSKREINRQRWHERVKAWKNSGQTQQAFCKAHHLGYASFRRWRRLLKTVEPEAATDATGMVRFLPVKVHETIPSNLVVLIQDDLRIEVRAGFNPHLLQQIIQVLRAS
jgi:hypothetical protein